jgi:hypothetical protein
MTTDVTSPKPIETRYNGYRFRSRLEARWAVFFDALGLAYEYEPQGFVLFDGTPYLPDFHLPALGMYAEVKPVVGDDPSAPGGWMWKAAAFARSGKPMLLLVGVPDVVWYSAYLPSDRRPWLAVECVDFGKSADIGRPWYAFTGDVFPTHDLLTQIAGDPFGRAVDAARGARFEHGETPTALRPRGRRR